jgi:DNA-binding response OmpR family regulator
MNHAERRMWEWEKQRMVGDARAVLAPSRILLADDDDEMRRLLAEALREDGYEVLEARNGQELLTQVRSSVFRCDAGTPADALVADIRMPGRSGLEVLNVVRDADWAVPVVLITAFGDDETHAEANRMGADVVLDKPFDPEDLLAALRRLVARRDD